MNAIAQTNPIKRLLGVCLLSAMLLGGTACGDLLTLNEDTCTMSGASATLRGSSSAHAYQYDVSCSGAHGFNTSGRVNASFDPATGVAQEKYVVTEGTITAEWTCLRDPWVRAANDDFGCVLVDRKANLKLDNRQLTNLLASAPPRLPYSTLALASGDRKALDSQLQAAIKQAQPARTRTPNLPIGAPDAQLPARTYDPTTVGNATSHANSLPKAPIGTTIDRSSDVYVRWVQAALNKVNNAQIPVDGDFGPVTRDAVMAFQQRVGIKVDGIVGPTTEARLVAAGAVNPPGDRRTGLAGVK